MSNSKEGTVWMVPAGKLAAAQTKLWNELNGQGAAIITQIDEDEHFRLKVADFMLRRGIEPSTDQRIVRAIMGKNYFGPEDWVKLYGASFTKKQLRELASFPWNEEILMSTCPLCGKTVHDCHFAHVGLPAIQASPLSIVKFREFYPETGQPKFYAYGNAWYNDNDFAKVTTLQLRWYLTHTEIVPKSENKTTQDQQAMLPAEYELPLAIEETFKSFHAFKKTDALLNPKRYARCRDLSSDGYRVDVGDFGSGRFNVGRFSDDTHDVLGAGASRLPDR
ncbi:MAG: hypothetical protein UW06_C0034G0016 [Parcubacteria group bacterium GW2011_GWE1_43_8]|nr:MAG: hypothetical protein UW06_C0034G0016 [Parcubacteria group bacterium GW2011_GWE1_43_8]